MGVTSTLDVSLLAAVADGLAARAHSVLLDTGGDGLVMWAANIEASETGDDRPGQPDYDESLELSDDGPNSVTIFTRIPWAEAQEFGGRFNPPRPSLTQAIEALRSDFPQRLAAAWLP